MNRRQVLGSLIGMPAVLGAADQPSEKLGFVDVERAIAMRLRDGIELHALFNGEDVTNRCVEADDVKGYVLLNRLDAAGHEYLDRDLSIARECLHGDVRFVLTPYTGD